MTTHERRWLLPSPALQAAILLACAIAGACTHKPLETTPIAAGDATLQTERRQLAGRWALISLAVSAADGRQQPVAAEGDLTLDDFGNLTIEYRLGEAGRATLVQLGAPDPGVKIVTTGRATIDVAAKRITYVPPDAGARTFDSDLAARRASPFTLERVRHYTLDDRGVLTLTTQHDTGGDAMTSRWVHASAIQ